MMRTRIPRFRVPEQVIDEEIGYILDLGVEFRSESRVESLKSLLAEGWDAVFIGTGAPRGQDLPLPDAERRPQISTSASNGWQIFGSSTSPPSANASS